MAQVEILWDRWGVPHIYGQDEVDMAYGAGWAQAHSHGNALLQLIAQARGDAASIYGEAMLTSDQQVRTQGVPQHGTRFYQQSTPRYRKLIDAYAQGINTYANQHPDALSQQAQAVLPVTGEDVSKHGVRAVYFHFIYNDLVQGLKIQQWVKERGSNAWAIAPHRTANGSTLLMGNPHLPWEPIYLFYEIHFNMAGQYCYGVSLLGNPAISIGFNDIFAWTHTVNVQNGVTLYQLALTAGGYVLDGEVKPFDVEQQSIQVLQTDGNLREEPFMILRSDHGPVVAQRDGQAVAVRIAGLDRVGWGEQAWDKMWAQSLEAVESLYQRMQAPMFNTIYADREGNIYERYNALIPVRSEGDFAFWLGFVPGDRTDLIWTDYHPYEDLPELKNPTSGWVASSNEPPWYMTIPYPMQASDYPPYMTLPRTNDVASFRPQNGMRMLLNDEPMTFEQVLKYRWETQSELAKRILDDLIAVARASGQPLAQQAAEVLAQWDRHYEPESRGAVLFARWYQPLYYRGMQTGQTIFAQSWDDDAEPLTTPNGLLNPTEAVGALMQAAGEMLQRGIPLDAPWGDVMRMRFGDVDLPARGGPGWDAFRVLTPTPEFTDDNTLNVFGGDTFIFAVEFGDTIRAEVLMVYGNATQSDSPHVADQMPLYARNEMRPAWYTRTQVEANLEQHDQLPPMTD